MENFYSDPKLFGKFIKLLREKYNMSRSHVAEKLNLSSQSSVMNFETGHTSMRLCHISKFCEMLPGDIAVPILLSMFEAGTTEAPCACICHYDLNDSFKSIYDSNDRCRHCGHVTDDCRLVNGVFFVIGK